MQRWRSEGLTAKFARLPRHVGFIPDGNRRWAEIRGLPRREGYGAGIRPGLSLLRLCAKIGIQEVTIYGFTKENVRRPPDQVKAFSTACADFGVQAIKEGAALQVIGDTSSKCFPAALKPYARKRSDGDLRVNFLVNYGWQWDLAAAVTQHSGNRASPRALPLMLASRHAGRLDLLVRWGGRRRLSGFLPVQSAYADFYTIDTLWPDMCAEEFIGALLWFAEQDVTLGG